MKANLALANCLGYTQAELQGRSLSSLFSPKDLDKLDHLRSALTQKSKAKLEVLLLAKSGEFIPAWLFACQSQGQILIYFNLDDTGSEKSKRELLLREVHHRIKNNLQGIAGLLYNQALAHPELRELLITPIRQINSIASLYQLYSRGQDQVFLCQLCHLIAQAGQGLSPVKIKLDIPYVKTIAVQDQEAVTLSLILNELLANAIKHGQGPILLALRKEARQAQVILQNATPTRPALDFAQGVGLKTGLKLVKALLPKGAELSFAWQEAKLIAILTLRPPLVHLLP